MRDIYIEKNDLVCVDEPIRDASLIQELDKPIYIFSKAVFTIDYLLDLKGYDMGSMCLKNLDPKDQFSALKGIGARIYRERIKLKKLNSMLHNLPQNYFVLDGMHRVINSEKKLKAKEIETDKDLEELAEHAPVEELVLHVHLLNFYHYANWNGFKTAEELTKQAH